MVKQGRKVTRREWRGRRLLRVRNLTQQLVLGDAVALADRFYQRFLGLMFRPHLNEGEGIWLEPSQAVHTHFMRFAIDLLFLDREGRVLKVMQGMQPWRISPIVKEARAVVELPVGGARTTQPGDLIRREG